MKKLLSQFMGVLTIFAMTFNAALATSENQDNITICHATGSQNNPYNVITVDPNGWNGHGDHEGDFIVTDQDGDQDIDDTDCVLMYNDEQGDDDDDDCDNQNTTVSIDADDDDNGDDDCGDDCDEQNPAIRGDVIVGDDDDNGDDDDSDDDCGDDDDQEETCPIVYARVKFAKVSNGAEVDGWRNWGPGADLAPQTYVGGDQPANLYADEAWFPLTNPDGSYITDTSVNTYSDVPGVAIQRLNGKVRFVLYGRHTAENSEFGGKEYAAGVIQLSENATWTPGMQSPLDWSNANSNPRTHDATINDAENPMDSRGDFTGYIDEFNERFDRMKTWAPDRVAFALTATTGTDGFYASYDVNQDCNEEEVCVPQPGLPVYARIKFSKISDGALLNGWRNWGVGADMAPKVFVGGNNPLPNESAGNMYDDEEWFMIYDGLNYVNDADIAAYQDVPGLAVQRMNGKLRVVLNGYHNSSNGELGGRELAAGVIQFSNDGSTLSLNALPNTMKSPMNWGPGNVNDGWSNSNSNPRTHDPLVNDAANPMDDRGPFNGNIDQNDERFDRVRVLPGSNKVEFHLVVTTGNDGFYASYTHTPGIDCEEEEVIPQ